MKCKKGLLVRRMINNVPIGPWMEVVSSDTKWVYCRPIGQSNIALLSKDNVWVPKRKSLAISGVKIKEIKNDKEVCVSHEATKQWMDVYENTPDIIFFFDNNGWEKVYCTIDTIKLISHYTTKRIQITIDRVIV